MLYASDCYASGPRSIGSSICTFIRTCIWIFIFNLEILYEIFFQRSPCICCPYLFMVPDPDMELEWAMPSSMLLVWKPKHLWSVNGKGIGFWSPRPRILPTQRHHHSPTPTHANKARRTDYTFTIEYLESQSSTKAEEKERTKKGFRYVTFPESEYPES